VRGTPCHSFPNPRPDKFTDFGLVYTLKILTRADLDRQIVKSSSSTVIIPELELTIPPSRGKLTNVEGLLRSIVEDLEPEQVLRRIQQPEAYEKVQGIIDRLRLLVPEDTDESDAVEKAKIIVKPLTLKLEDPSGNSFIEFLGNMSDPQWSMREYTRSVEDNVRLGLVSPDAIKSTKVSDPLSLLADAPSMDEVFIFPGICSSCSRPLDTKMKRVDIPYFKEIIIMSTNCEACGYRDNEVKSSGAISEKGKKITLRVEDMDDLSRDILKVSIYLTHF
jgi:zinc finger protein